MFNNHLPTLAPPELSVTIFNLAVADSSGGVIKLKGGTMCNKKVTKDVFDRVKYSLKMGDRVAFVANKNRLGETTVRRIQKARTYKQYKDLANDRIRNLHSNRNTARVIRPTHTVRHRDNIPEYIALFLSSIVTILAVVALVMSLWGSK